MEQYQSCIENPQTLCYNTNTQRQNAEIIFTEMLNEERISEPYGKKREVATS